MFSLPVDHELSLALVSPVYADELFALIKRDEDYLQQWLPWPKFNKRVEDHLAFVKQSLHDYADGKSLVCVILYQGKPVGTAGFNHIRHNLKKAEIGYWLGAEYQGKGIMSRVCHKLCQLAFEQYQLDKVQISAAVGNKPSRAVCERLGLRLEGVITQAENLGDRIVDHAVYGISRQEFYAD